MCKLHYAARQALLLAVQLANFDFRSQPGVQRIDACKRDILAKDWRAH